MSHPASHPAPFHLAAALCLAAVAAALPARAAGMFDGTYRGGQTVFRTDNSIGCDRSTRNNVAIKVIDNQFTVSWGHGRAAAHVALQVAPDGSFKGEGHATNVHGYANDGTEVQGRITGDVLQGEISNTRCGVRMTLHKS